MRKCKDCKEEKSLDEFYVNCRGDVYTRCIECEKAYQRQRYRENKEKILAQKKQHRAENKEETFRQARESRERRKPIIDARRERLFAETPHDVKKKCGKCGEDKAVVEFYKGDSQYGRHSICIECGKKRKKKHYEENKDEICEQNRACYQKHKEEIKEWRIEHKEELRVKRKIYYEKNKERIREYRKLWRQNNPQEGINSRAKRSKLIGNATITKDDWLAIMFSNNWRCYYCEVELTKDNRSVDHVTPLALGGAHHPSNLVPSCTSCNSSKGDRKLEEWDTFHKLAESKQTHLKEIWANGNI